MIRDANLGKYTPANCLVFVFVRIFFLPKNSQLIMRPPNVKSELLPEAATRGFL